MGGRVDDALSFGHPRIGISCTMGSLEGAVNKGRCGGYRLKTNRSLSEIGCAYSFRMKNSPNG